MVIVPMSMPACDIGIAMCSWAAMAGSAAGFAAACWGAAAVVALGVAIAAPDFAVAHATVNGKTSSTTAVARLLKLFRLGTVLERLLGLVRRAGMGGHVDLACDGGSDQCGTLLCHQSDAAFGSTRNLSDPSVKALKVIGYPHLI